MSIKTDSRNAIRAVALACGIMGLSQTLAGSLEISFPEAEPAGTLADFPALVVFSEGSGGFSYDGFLSPQGYDLRFSNAIGTVELDYEIETWNPNGMSYVWVRLPEFTSSSVVRAYWGDPDFSEQPACCTNGAVWQEPYRGVWHLTPELKDSTAYANHGDPSSATTDRVGPVGHSRQMAEGQGVSLSEPSGELTVSNRFTFSFWARTPLPAAKNSYIYILRTADGSSQMAVICGYNDNHVEFYAKGYEGSNPRDSSAIAIPDGDWHQYVYSYDGEVWSGYRDGVSVFSVARVFSLNNLPVTRSAQIGSSPAGEYFEGAIDEFRVEAEPRTAEWIQAAYLNQRKGMLRRAAVRFPEYDREETLTNFPALVVLNDKLPNFSYDTFRSPEGLDLRFSDDTGTQLLDYEVETWDPDGNSYVWVRVPEFSAAGAISAVWGDADMAYMPACCTNGAVWQEPFRGVWHLDSLTDSTAYTNAGWEGTTASLRGPVGVSARRTGAIAGIGLKGTSEHLAVSNRFTFSFWAKADFPTASQMYMYQLAPAAGGQQTGFLCGYVPNTIEFFASGGLNTGNVRSGSQMSMPDADWHHYTYTYDGAKLTGCRDGATVFQKDVVFSLNPLAGTNSVTIGAANAGKNIFKGALDEFRVESSPRSTNWVYACYRNQKTRHQGLDYLEHPVFDKRATVSAVGQHAVHATSFVSCRGPVEGRLYYGSADGGEAPGAWDAFLALGSLGAGSVESDINDLQPDRNYALRFWASNHTGVVWSEPIAFRTAPDVTRYNYRMPIRLSGYTGEATLTNFPVLVKLNDAIPGFSYQYFSSVSGYDLRFTDENNAPLNYEIESWDPDGDSFVWVQVPELRQGQKIWAFFHNRDMSDLPAYCEDGGAWEDAFCGVFHLTPALQDSGYGANHVVQDTGTAPTLSLFSPARSFVTGAGLNLGVSDSLGVTDAFTFSFWARIPYPQTNGVYLYTRYPANEGGGQHSIICGYAANKLEFFAINYYGAEPRYGITLPDGDWHHYAFTYDGWNWSGYRDGNKEFGLEKIFSLAYCNEVNTDRGRIGNDRALARAFPGDMDELRVESVCRTEEWLQACYLNQTDCETFAVCGPAVNLKGFLISIQ